jgi:cytochrome c553
LAWVKVWLIILLLHFTAAGIARAQDDDSAGERLFRLHCAECHGLDGQGVPVTVAAVLRLHAHRPVNVVCLVRRQELEQIPGGCG